MRLLGILIGAATIVVLGGCSGDGTEAKRPVESKPTPAVTQATPTSSATGQTYIRIPGDPKTHILHVTIRDEGELRAYIPGANNECASTAPKGFPHELIVSGPDADESRATLGQFEAPATARRLSHGVCEAKMTITVPYAPRYTLGVGMAGQGIADPNAPRDVWVVTNGKSQDVITRR